MTSALRNPLQNLNVIFDVDEIDVEEVEEHLRYDPYADEAAESEALVLFLAGIANHAGAPVLTTVDLNSISEMRRIHLKVDLLFFRFHLINLLLNLIFCA